MTSLWKAVIGVLLIFAFGFISGVFCSSIVAHKRIEAFMKHPGRALSAALEHNLTGNLNLDANQKEQIHQIFLDNLKRHQQLQQQIQPQLKLVNRDTVQEITAVLRPDQLAIFHQNIDNVRKDFGKIAANPNQETPPGSDAAPTAPATPAESPSLGSSTNAPTGAK